MTAKENGEQAAFASPETDGATWNWSGSAGLTKREYFAGQCLAGMIAASEDAVDPTFMARRAVLLADELLGALGKQP